MAGLVFVPWHDARDFSNNGILTRDQYVLYCLTAAGMTPFVSCEKPRTVINKPQKAPGSYFQEDSVAGKVKAIYDQMMCLGSYKFFDHRQATMRRTWWSEVYREYAAHQVFAGDLSGVIAYSNNPFAFPLLLSLREKGAAIIFDAMDNFAIHPSLTDTEHQTAYRGYGKMANSADFLSANSGETCEYFGKHFARQPLLLKNGVLREEYGKEMLEKAPETPLERQLEHDKQGYKGVAAYLGKMSLRMDSGLVSAAAAACPDWLFAFVGPKIGGQCGSFDRMVKGTPNVKYYPAIPSGEVPAFLRAADVFTIPNLVGQNEIGGNPLKMYQYMMTGKPILSTATPGVAEFPDIITVRDSAEGWARTLRSWGESRPKPYDIPHSILWEQRLRPMIDFATNGRK